MAKEKSIGRTVIDSLLEDKDIHVMDKLKRFQIQYNFEPESVSQHTFWVIYFVYFVLHFIKRRNLTKEEELMFYGFYSACTMRAIFHDMPEIFTGDIMYPVKYCFGEASKNIKSELEKIEKEEINKFEFGFMDSVNSAYYQRGEKDELVEMIVKFCDWLACYKKAYREQFTFGNNDFIQVVDECQKARRNMMTPLKEMIEKGEGFNKLFEAKYVSSLM